MEGIEKVKQGLISYHGVAVGEESNEDMKHVYEMSYSSKEQARHPMGAYSHFKKTMGQFSRICI